MDDKTGHWKNRPVTLKSTPSYYSKSKPAALQEVGPRSTPDQWSQPTRNRAGNHTHSQPPAKFRTRSLQPANKDESNVRGMSRSLELTRSPSPSIHPHPHPLPPLSPHQSPSPPQLLRKEAKKKAAGRWTNNASSQPRNFASGNSRILPRISFNHRTGSVTRVLFHVS